MNVQQNYEVIRFVQQNGKYHVIMDYVEGELLCNYLRRERQMDKKFPLEIALLLAKELSCLEKSAGKEMYPFVTPLHIIIKKDKSIALLKTNDKYNQQIEDKIYPFLSSDGTDDFIYSYGRTLQFILSNIECVPYLSWKEERKFKIIISKCLNYKSKKRYQNAQDIVSQLNPKKKKTILFLFPIVALAMLALMQYKSAYLEKQNVQDFEPQKTSFQVLQEFLIGEDKSPENELRQIVTEYRESLGQEISIAQMEFLFRVYSKMDNEYGRLELIKIAAQMFEELADNREIIANIYIEQKEYEKAIKEYEILLKEDPSAERYLSLVSLLEQNGRQREAMILCKEGCQFEVGNTELQLQFVRLLLMDIEYSSEEKKTQLDEFLSLYPNVIELEKFQDIKKQTGFEENKDED